jgi:acetyl-CoA carboxylase biotin carboxyl carrier protein
MTIEEIRELIAVVNQSGIAELEVQRGENRVRIKRTQREVRVAVPQALEAHAVAAPAPIAAPGASPASAKPSNGETLVKSPIVGTFYESSSPGSAPFVRVGETVKAGQVLCIIESMKLMNEIEAEVAGIVMSKLVQNGQPVEYGEALFAVRPL